MCAFSQLRGNWWSRQICNTKCTLMRIWQTNKGRMESSWTNSSFNRWQVIHLDFRKMHIHIPNPLHSLHNLTAIEGYFEYQWVAMMSAWTWCKINKQTTRHLIDSFFITCQRVWFLEMPQRFDEGIRLYALNASWIKYFDVRLFIFWVPAHLAAHVNGCAFLKKNICNF